MLAIGSNAVTVSYAGDTNYAPSTSAPFTVVVYQNGAYSTGTLQVSTMYPESYAKKVAYDGGTFAAIDFAKEAEACGAYGENVSDPAQIMPALKRAREANGRGLPAVVSVQVQPLF